MRELREGVSVDVADILVADQDDSVGRLNIDESSVMNELSAA